jgi:uncharacterized protein YlxW (UPF0749 family)
MTTVEESKRKLSEAFSRLESLIEIKLHKSNKTHSESSDTELLNKVNQSLLEQNQALQTKLHNLERKYSEIRNINKETTAQIDDIISNLKILVSK